MTNNDIVENLISKICHDLLNPLSTAQMAIETESFEYIKPAIDELILKIDMIRYVYRDSIEDSTKYIKLKNYISEKKLNLQIQNQHPYIVPLLFWIAEKMIIKSYVYVEDEAIHLQKFFIDEEELEILEQKTHNISSKNIFLYITMKKLSSHYEFKTEELGSNEWKIIIKKK